MNTTVTAKQFRVGWLLTGLVSAFLGFDAIIHLLNVGTVKTAMSELGWPEHLAPVIGIIEAAALCLLLYARTSLLGAVLVTAYLGGAVASNLRIEEPLLSTTLFPVYVAIVLWGGLYLKDRLLRSVVHAARQNVPLVPQAPTGRHRPLTDLLPTMRASPHNEKDR